MTTHVNIGVGKGAYMLGGNGTLPTPVVGGFIQDLSRGSMVLLSSAQMDLRGWNTNMPKMRLVD